MEEIEFWARLYIHFYFHDLSVNDCEKFKTVIKAT